MSGEKENNQQEKVQKSQDEVIDGMIDELFSKSEDETPSEDKVEKAKWGESNQEGNAKAGGYTYPSESPSKQSKYMKDGSSADDPKAPTTADATGNEYRGDKNPKEDDEAEGKRRGRPDEDHDVPSVDQDGNRAKGYESVQEDQKKTPDISDKGTVHKSESETVEISKEDYELLKKAKEQQKEEELQKAKEEQKDLIKSAVQEATADYKKENEELKKSLQETQEMVKKMASRPQQRKSIDSVQALEKSFGEDPQQAQSGSGNQRNEAFSKSEMLDAAEELVQKGKLSMEQVIELDDTGYIYDPEARQTLEKYLRKNG